MTTPAERAHFEALRLLDLATSDAPLEHETGEREIDRILADPKNADWIEDALQAAILGVLAKAVRKAPQARPSELPDTPWRPWVDRFGTTAWERRLNGHILVIREHPSRAGWFIAAVDGRDFFSRYWPTVGEARDAAEREAQTSR